MKTMCHPSYHHKAIVNSLSRCDKNKVANGQKIGRSFGCFLVRNQMSDFQITEQHCLRTSKFEPVVKRVYLPQCFGNNSFLS